MEDINLLVQNLKKKGYQVLRFASKEEATVYMDSQLNQTVIGIGGSQTVAEMGLYEALASHNTVYWHDRKPEHMSVMEARKAAGRAPIYISSVNAISVNGEIVNIDNTGNRVAAISFGPEQVYLVVGCNKITADYDTALYRARNVAAPLNAQRLHRKTPCAAKADKCYDCMSPERICRNLSVLWEKPTGAEYYVILIEEELGY